jgi:cytochrome c peroxidase
LLAYRKFKPYVQKYAKDEAAFFSDFASAFSKLLELGVPFPESAAAAASPAPKK